MCLVLVQDTVMMIRKIFLQLRSDILLELYDENLVNQMIFKKTVDYCYNYLIFLRGVSISRLCPSTIIQTLLGILIGIMVNSIWTVVKYQHFGVCFVLTMRMIRSLEDVKITLSLKSMKRYLLL